MKKRPNGRTRVTLDLYYLGKVTATYYAFNQMYISFILLSDDDLKEGYANYSGMHRKIADCIWENLHNRGFYISE